MVQGHRRGADRALDAHLVDAPAAERLVVGRRTGEERAVVGQRPRDELAVAKTLDVGGW